MAGPVRFPRGLSTFPSRHTLNSFPIGTSPSQIAFFEDFLPYRAGDYLVTQTNGSATPLSFNSGAIKLATTGTTAADKIQMIRNGNVAGPGALPYAFIPGQQLWYNCRVAYPRSVLNTNDTDIQFGLLSNTGVVGNNAAYFSKSAGGTAVDFILKQGGTTTKFNNIGDLALPSGIYGDSQSTSGVLRATIAGNAFSQISVAQPGSGYMVAPLILTTAAAGGTVGSIPAICSLGSASFAANTGAPIQTTQLPYASLYAPFINNAGSGFTNQGPLNTLLEVEPLLDFSFYYDGGDTIFVGVNGRTLFSIGASGNPANSIVLGNNTNMASYAGGPSLYCGSNLSANIMPVQQAPGSVFGIAPFGGMAPGFAMSNTTAAARSFYIIENSVAVEYL